MLITQVNDQLPKRDVKEMVRLIDSTTISLNINQFKWAEFRKNKGGLKLHTVYDPMAEVPVYFEMTNAKVNDRKALDSTPIESGIIYVIDRTYNDYQWYYNLTEQGCSFVGRMKKDAIYEVVNSLNHSGLPISNSKTLKSARLKAIHQLKVDSIEQQISAINATHRPNISGEITTTFYDIARRLNEYEVTGGINIALPLFDSGRSDVQMQSALNNIGIEDEKFRSLIFDKELALEDLNRQVQSLRSVNSSNLIKQAELNEKITRLELKQKTSNSAFVAIVQTQIELGKLERDLLNYDYVGKQSNLKYLRLNETLLSEFSKLNLNQ
jgi:hypothetical protein